MRVEWLSEARNEYRQLLQYYKTEVGLPYARKFASKILTSVNQLERFPEIGVLKYDTLMGKHGFRALFIDQYACVYKIEGDTVYIYHLADARKNYIYHIGKAAFRVECQFTVGYAFVVCACQFAFCCYHVI